MTRPIRIAQILPYPGVGGTEHATLRIVEAMSSRGIESVAFCLPTARPVIEFFREARLEVATWEPRYLRRGERAGFLLQAARLAWELRRRGIDLVHCADVPAASWGPAAAARLAGLPAVCHVYNRHPSLESFNVLGLRAVNRFVFVSEATWRHFALRVPRERGRVIYYGFPPPPPMGRDAIEAIRNAVRREFGFPESAKVVGMVARVEPQKDFATFARAAARIIAAEPDVRFLVVGGIDRTPAQREHYPQVRAQLAASGVASHCHFAGFRSDIDRLLRALDVFVLSTHWEGLPLSVVEAMLRDIPVVATAVDGMPEFVEDGTSGLLVAHEGDRELAAKVQSLLVDPARAAGLGRAGGERARTMFDEDRFGTEIYRLYSDLLGRRTLARRGVRCASAARLPQQD
jgi:glycosyltransferase involved in cell wall biosynthesis